MNPLLKWRYSLTPFRSRDYCADLCGVCRPTFADWENGKSLPQKENAKKLKEVTEGKVTRKKLENWISV